MVWVAHHQGVARKQLRSLKGRATEGDFDETRGEKTYL
jgi:hypothetical protein